MSARKRKSVRTPQTRRAPAKRRARNGASALREEPDVSLGSPRVRSPAAPVRIVAIGASAGGLEALEALLDGMPANLGLALVVVTQAAGHVNLLPELLARRTKLPVVLIRDGISVQPDHVYVSPGGKNLAIVQGTLQVMDPAPGSPLHLPIDYFFRSLADDQGERAICVVLSGTGTDGTLGLRAIKGRLGMAMVQAESSAKYSGMPQSAAATGLADYVLPPERMLEQIAAYVGGARSEAAEESPSTTTATQSERSSRSFAAEPVTISAATSRAPCAGASNAACASICSSIHVITSASCRRIRTKSSCFSRSS